MFKDPEFKLDKNVWRVTSRLPKNVLKQTIQQYLIEKLYNKLD